MAEIMFFVAGIWPMGMPLQEPVVTWTPLVTFWPAQKFMKLLLSLFPTMKISKRSGVMKSTF